MKETSHTILSVVEEHAVVFADIHRFFDRYGGGSVELRIDLQRIKQKKYISGEHQHPVFNAGRHSGHSDHKLIKKCGTMAVWQFSRHRSE